MKEIVISDELQKFFNKENEPLKELAKEYDTLINNAKDKEIERLNNIINELEKWLQEEIKSTKEKIKVCDDEEDRGIYLDKVYNYKDILDKLKELKGDDKE